jgi:hypothetical protein
MISIVGIDNPYYLMLVKPTLEESRVVMDFIVKKRGSQKGSATIIVEGGEASRENCILVVLGANYLGISKAKIILSKIKG